MQEKRVSDSDANGHQDKKTHISEANIDDDLLNQSEFVNAEGDGEGEGEGESQKPDEPQQPPQTETDGQEKEISTQQHILHPSTEKPLAGSEEWHRIRKDNHKEVERRRRETINGGIKELAALLPSPETNKSQVLHRASEYIKRLRENDKNNAEKWTLEKLLGDQAIAELTAANEKLKTELERAYREVEHWKKICSIAKSSDK